MIEYVTTDEGIPELFEALVAFHNEHGIAPLSVEKTLAVVRDVVHNHFAVIARVEGKVAGTIGIFEVELWYADTATCLTDKWLWVAPEHRGKIAVYRALMEAARGIATDMKLPLYISPTHAARREPRTGVERIGSSLGFAPLGSITLMR